MVAGEPKIGDVLDSRYRITGLLGSGGMGSVYRAEHVTIKRPVAIKVLHADFAEDPDYSKRFAREAFVTGRTDHPNCVTVSDFGKLSEGGFYLVMELVDGTVLGDLLDEEERLPVRRALHIARHVLRGLGHAHAAGIVHRDVKPNNIILVKQADDPEFAKLLDFGIAKLVDGAAAAKAEGTGTTELTRVGTTVGTPTYVAPEQAVGGAVDRRSDLYSLSVVLYEMIVGRPPFRNDEMVKVLAMHLSAPVPPMDELCPGLVVSPAVEGLVWRGLAKDKADRYPDAEAYVAAIDELFARQVVDPPPVTGRAASTGQRPVGAVASSARWTPGATARSRRTLLIIGALIALVVIIGVAAGGGGANPTSRPGVAEKSASQKSSSTPPEARPKPRGRTRTSTGVPPTLPVAKPAEGDPEGANEIERGRARLAARRPGEALAAFRRGLEMDPDLAGDQRLESGATALLGARDPSVAVGAVELLAAMNTEWSRGRLVELASEDTRNAVRRAARALAEKQGIGEQVDRLKSYALDLMHGKTCPERARAVPVLRELNDPRAIPALERARKRRTGGILGFGTRSMNGCMKAQLDEAIAHLEKL